MPDLSGHGVIKALNELEETPIIGIITGWGEELIPMSGDNYNVDFIVKKPFDFEELSSRINSAINSG